MYAVACNHTNCLIVNASSQLQTKLDTYNLSCSAKDFDKLRVTTMAHFAADSLYQTLKKNNSQSMPGTWWWCNVVCPGEVSMEIVTHIATLYYNTNPYMKPDMNPVCDDVCSGYV